MSTHNDRGQKAEEQAVGYFSDNGYIILHTNYRFSHYEIDIIALKDDVLHFIEVKSLTGDPMIHPERHVTPKKFQSLKKAASNFLSKNPTYKHVQFDILSIVMKKDIPEFFLIEDVYL